MNIIKLPHLFQTYNYDCGVKALQIVLAYYGIKKREDYLIKHTKTSQKEGTPIQGIISLIKKYGLKIISSEMTIKDLKYFIKLKIPVILVLQAWTKQKKINWQKDWNDGHYVVAIGYTNDRIIFKDPFSFELTYLRYKELEKRWHDVDANGKKYIHHGIAVFGKPPRFKADKIIHMD